MNSDKWWINELMNKISAPAMQNAAGRKAGGCPRSQGLPKLLRILTWRQLYSVSHLFFEVQQADGREGRINSLDATVLLQLDLKQDLNEKLLNRILDSKMIIIELSWEIRNRIEIGIEMTSRWVLLQFQVINLASFRKTERLWDRAPFVKKWMDLSLREAHGQWRDPPLLHAKILLYGEPCT